MSISLYSPELPDTMAATLEQLAPVIETPDMPCEAFLALDDCAACEAAGTVETGAARWSREAGAYEVGRVRCPVCRGAGVIAVEPAPLALDELLALDASASDAEGLFSGTATHAWWHDETRPVLETLVEVLGDAARAILVAAVHAAAAAVELRAREDEHDGELVARAGRDEAPTTVPASAPVLALPSRRRPASRAA